MFQKRTASPQHRNRRNGVILVLILLVSLATSWVWAYDANADVQVTEVTASADDPCYMVSGGGVIVEEPCGRKPLPEQLRKTLGSTAAGCLLAMIARAPVGPGCFAGAVGSIPWEGVTD